MTKKCFLREYISMILAVGPIAGVMIIPMVVPMLERDCSQNTVWYQDCNECCTDLKCYQKCYQKPVELTDYTIISEQCILKVYYQECTECCYKSNNIRQSSVVKCNLEICGSKHVELAEYPDVNCRGANRCYDCCANFTNSIPAYINCSIHEC